jgi:hypothetical protein
MAREEVLRRRIRALMVLFIAGMLLSGVTAFPIQAELKLLSRVMGLPAIASPAENSALDVWLVTVRNGLDDMYGRYPWIAYGTDWLAFAHVVLAILFIGPLRDPVRNLWVIEFGLIACVLIIPLAMICGPIRGIPFFWRLIDCSFGVAGFIPLWLCRRFTLELAEQEGYRTRSTSKG